MDEARLRFRFETTQLPRRRQEVFRAYAATISETFEHSRISNGIPEYSVEILVADDFIGAISRHLNHDGMDEPPLFVADRVGGGRVVAKNLYVTPDGSEILIAFDAHLLMAPDPEQVVLAQLLTTAHELAHPLINRARHASGALEGVIVPSFTATEVARSLSRILIDEYRADGFAEAFARHAASSTDATGALVPVDAWSQFSAAYLDGLADALAEAHPGWADLVQTYREGRVPLDEMWRQIVSGTEQVLTAWVHTRAHADFSGQEVAVLDADSLRDLPAVRLYLKGNLDPFLEALRAEPLISPLSEFRAIDDRLVAAGELAIKEIWKKLGLTFTENPNRQWELHVTAPVR